MLDHPVIRTALLFLGAYFLLNALGRLLGPIPPTLAVVAAALCGAVVWMYHFEYERLQVLYKKPGAAPVIDLVCRKVLNAQPPVGTRSDLAAVSPVEAESDKGEGEREDTGKLLLVTDEDYGEAEHELGQAIVGHEENVWRLLQHVRANVQLRAESSARALQPPIGIFLLVGPDGLGKEHLATEFAARIYQGGPLLVLDLRENPAPTSELLEAVKGDPHLTILIQGVDLATEEFLRDLDQVAEKGLLFAEGKPVSFRHTFLFLSSTKRASSVAQLQATGFGATMMTARFQAITEDTAFEARLASLIDEVFLFALPSESNQAAVVLLLMERECNRYGLELAHVAPAVLLREVRAIAKAKCFEQTPGRITRLLRRPIIAAKQSGASSISVGTTSLEEAFGGLPLERPLEVTSTQDATDLSGLLEQESIESAP